MKSVFQNSSPNANRTQANLRQSNPYSKSAQKPNSSQYKTARKSERNGFGFEVKLNDDDQILVSKVDSKGNAAEAGIRRGDQIKEIGGIEASSIEEFNEIAKIMSDGDQMEFLVRRGGRDRKIDVQFGNIPEPQQNPTVSNDVNSSRLEKRYDFAPPNFEERKQTSSSILAPAQSRQSRQGMIQASAPVTQRFSDQAKPNNQIQRLNQVIQRQNQQIMRLQQEIIRLNRRR